MRAVLDMLLICGFPWTCACPSQCVINVSLLAWYSGDGHGCDARLMVQWLLAISRIPMDYHPVLERSNFCRKQLQQGPTGAFQICRIVAPTASEWWPDSRGDFAPSLLIWSLVSVSNGWRLGEAHGTFSFFLLFDGHCEATNSHTCPSTHFSITIESFLCVFNLRLCCIVLLRVASTLVQRVLCCE